MRQKSSLTKSCYSLPLPFLFIKFIDTRSFLKHRRVPLRNVSVPWEKNRRRIVILLALLCMKNVDIRNFLKHRRAPLQSFLQLWDESFSTENRDTPSLLPPLILKSFRCTKFSERQNGSSTEWFNTVRQRYGSEVFCMTFLKLKRNLLWVSF